MQGRHALFVEYTSTPIRERGSLLGAVIVFRDITQRRESEERLRTALAEVDRLSHYAWPGNVRELENAIERAAILAVRGQLRFDLLTIGAPLSAASRLRAGEPTPLVTEAERKSRDRENIRAALDASSGRIFGPTGAAALLEVPPTTLISRMKALGIARPREQDTGLPLDKY